MIEYIMKVHSSDDKEAGVAHELKTSLNFPTQHWGSTGQVKLSPNKLSGGSEMLSKSYHGKIMKQNFLLTD